LKLISINSFSFQGSYWSSFRCTQRHFQRTTLSNFCTSSKCDAIGNE